MQAATDSGEPPQLGAGQIKFWPLGAAFYLNYHLVELGVFKNMPNGDHSLSRFSFEVFRIKRLETSSGKPAASASGPIAAHISA